MDYEDHEQVLKSLKDDQFAEYDSREEVDEVINFHNGDQWEPDIEKLYDGRPKYTFDQSKPIISDIWAEMAANDYACRVDPVGDGANKDVADLLNGILRGIYAQSNFDDTSTKVGKRGILSGFGSVQLRAGYIGESFYQDIMIDYIPDSHRRVWFQAGSEKQTREDAMHAHKLSANISKDEAKRRWGEERGFVSVDNGARHNSTEEYKPKDMLTIGEIFYKKPFKKTIYLIDDEESTVTDDDGLKRMNIQADSEMVIASREAECFKVYSRKYDGKGWLEDKPKLSAFKMLPVVPMYTYFDVHDGKVRFEGAIKRVLDACRVFNYSESKNVEETALYMRDKLMADDRIIGQYADEFSTLNNDPRAVQVFDGAAADKIKHAFGPMQMISANTPNAKTTQLSNDMIRNIQISTGRVNAVEQQMAVGNDSDFRADMRESMGKVGTFEYYRGYKIFLEQVVKVALSGIPVVYDTPRKLTSIDEAGQTTEVEVNQKDYTGQILNNLTVGKYTATISVGDSMESRKAQANDGIIKLAQFDPAIVSRNADILASNMNAPGMDLVSGRERARLLGEDAIPPDQWTKKEKEAMAALSQQPTPPDPAIIIAQAEQSKVQSESLKAQAELELKQMELQGKQQIEAVKLELQKSKQDYDNLLKAVQAEKLSIEMGQPINQNVTTTAEEEIQ